MKITHIVLHYSATYEDQDITAADIDKMHKDRGWKGIGYHWFIRRDGTVEMGRPESQVGAHVGGQNSGKIGICCAGGLNRATGASKGVDNRTPAQIEAQIKLIRDILKRHPGAQVVGHKDLANTQCPGFDVRTWWANVEKKQPPAPAKPPKHAPVVTPDVGEDRFHVVEAGDTWWSVAREHALELTDLYALNGGPADRVLRVGDKVRVFDGPDDDKPVAPMERSNWFAVLLSAIMSIFAGDKSRQKDK